MSKELINLDTKRKQMTNQQKFPEDFEREAFKDAIYLQEEQEMIMREINEEEHRLPATITIIGPLPEKKKEENEVERNTLPF